MQNDLNELIDASSAKRSNKNIETGVDNNPDFQLSLEDSDSSGSSENILNLQNDEINTSESQDENRKRERCIKYELDKNLWEKNKNSLNREKGKLYKGKKKENGKWRKNQDS